MKKLFSTLLLLVACAVFNAYPQDRDSQNPLEIEDSTNIYLLTCQPGDELYSAFGHTAILVNDIVFNYGVFDFDTECFYIKFISGRTDYELGVDLISHFKRQYEKHGRTVIQQKLNLTHEEKTALFNALIDNAQPDKKTYRYNFIFDNCATRPRIKIEDCINGSVQYDTTKQYETYRELIGEYVGDKSWTKFGIDLLIGAEADRTASYMERLFLPDELHAAFQKAKKADGDKLVEDEDIIVYGNQDSDDNCTKIHPIVITLIVMTVIFLLTLLFPRKLKMLDFFLFLITGLVGTLIFYLTFFSLHPLVGDNWNLLWLNPIHLLIPLLIFNSKTKRFLIAIYTLTAIMAIIAIGGYLYLPQQFNIAFLPIMATVVVKAISSIRVAKINDK